MDNTRGYARVSHSRQWSNYNVLCGISTFERSLMDKFSQRFFLPGVGVQCLTFIALIELTYLPQISITYVKPMSSINLIAFRPNQKLLGLIVDQ